MDGGSAAVRTREVTRVGHCQLWVNSSTHSGGSECRLAQAAVYQYMQVEATVYQYMQGQDVVYQYMQALVAVYQHIQAQAAGCQYMEAQAAGC